MVITNPTRVAAALKYGRSDPNSAPVVVATGCDAVAQKIKAVAAENRITMAENVQRARRPAGRRASGASRRIALPQRGSIRWGSPASA